MSRVQNLPFFPIAPAQYSTRYFNELTRAFAVYMQQMQNPGDAVFTTLRLTNLPEYADNAAAVAAGKVAGTVYKTSTGELRIVV